MLIALGHTHAYPGCPVALRPDLGPTSPDALFEFSDGVTVTGQAEKVDGDQWQIVIHAHRTARGTAIAEKAWLVKAGQDGLVIGRLPRG